MKEGTTAAGGGRRPAGEPRPEKSEDSEEGAGTTRGTTSEGLAVRT